MFSHVPTFNRIFPDAFDYSPLAWSKLDWFTGGGGGNKRWKKNATCRLPNLVPRFLDFTLQWKTIVCVSRRVEEKRGAKGVNIYPPRNLIPRVIGLKILFPAQRSRELGGNGWKCLRNGEPRIAKSETRCWEKSRRTGSGESRYRQISARYVVRIGRWTEPISF